MNYDKTRDLRQVQMDKYPVLNLESIFIHHMVHCLPINRPGSPGVAAIGNLHSPSRFRKLLNPWYNLRGNTHIHTVQVVRTQAVGATLTG